MSAGVGGSRGELRRVIRLLIRFSGGRRLYVLALMMLVFEAITAVFQPYPLAFLIDFLQGERSGLSIDLPLLSGTRSQTVAVLTIGLILLTMINSLGDSLAEIYLARGGRDLGYNLRATLHAHLQRLSLAFHDQRMTGDMLTRVTSDVTALEDFVVKSVSDLAGSILVLTGTLAFLLWRSWVVAVIAVLIVPVLALVSNHYSQRIKSASKRQRASEGDLASAAQEMLSSIRVIQTYGRAEYETERFAVQSRLARDAALDTAGLQARFSWVVAVLEAVAISAVVWAGLWLIDRRTITIGTLVLFTVLIQNMFKPTRKIIREWSTIGKIFASVERIAEVLDRRPSVADLPDAVPAPAFVGELVFDGVAFSYRPDVEDEGEVGAVDRVALRDVTFSVAPGQVFALVGHSGAGKSTIAQLIPRLYDPDEGVVRIDGRDVRSFTLESLRSQIGVVLQDTVLFSGTVADNIAYGRPDATREQVVEAAVRANADGFIRELPEGYDTVLGERAANLSGGQRQRLAIARAFVRDAPILILDEPTTGLDAAATEQVLLGLRSLMAGKTTVIVTHHLSLIRSADRILVVDDGRIVEQGSHDELLAAGGRYAEYHALQTEPDGARSAAGESGRLDDDGLDVGTLDDGGLDQHGDEGPEEVRTHLVHAVASAASTVGDAADVRSLARAMALLDPNVPPAQSRAPAALDATPELSARLPGLAAALDPVQAGAALQARLLAPDVRLESCRPGKLLYLGDEGCSLRYEVEVRLPSGQRTEALVLGRVLADQAAAERYARSLEPLVRSLGARGHPMGPAFAVFPSGLVAHWFPIDPDLPGLVGATDPTRVAPVLRAAGLDVDGCTPRLGHYGRRHRCVLRYELEGPDVGSSTVFGKVWSDGRGERVEDTLRALAAVPDLQVPPFVGYVREMHLALLGALPGRPALATALRAGNGNGTIGRLVDAAAQAAARMHGCGSRSGPHRTIDDELSELRGLVELVGPVAPALADRLEGVLEVIAAAAAATDPQPLQFSHGDFTPSQVLSDGERCGVLDFDGSALAEPALDLGQYLAYLRLTLAKHGGHPEQAEELARRFVASYRAEAGGEHDEARVQVYECISLMRTAVHAWQKLKPARAAMVLDLLTDRSACLAPARS